MKYLSLFSGVEGFGIKIPNGEPVGFSEIDKYASMVLKYRFPNIKNYGDITKIRTEELPDFDLLTGGSPCQDLSIAGKRRGLAGARSGLFMEYIRILRDKKPRYFIWENVKGALSSNYGFDFAVVLNEFSESGYSLWWQVLNAKDFGVPQNRERIFVVGFREGSPKEVFFERENNQELNEQGEYELREQISNTLRTNYSNASSNETYVGVAPNGKQVDLTNIPDKPFQLQEVRTEKGKKSRAEIRKITGKDSTKRGRDDKKYIPKTDDLANCLTTGAESIEKWLFEGMGVRKLTPTECERLMSWPDDWTKWGIDDKGNKVEISDSQRYKMCGNGVVSNVVREIVKSLL